MSNEAPTGTYTAAEHRRLIAAFKRATTVAERNAASRALVALLAAAGNGGAQLVMRHRAMREKTR